MRLVKIVLDVLVLASACLLANGYLIMSTPHGRSRINLKNSKSDWQERLANAPSTVVQFDLSLMTLDEGPLLKWPVCMRFDEGNFNALLRLHEEETASGKRSNCLLNTLTRVCLSKLPLALWQLITKRNVHLLGEPFLNRIYVKSVSLFRNGALRALSPVQLYTLVKATAEEIVPEGSLCGAFKARDIYYFEKKRPELIAAFTPSCMANLGNALRGVGPRFLRNPARFSQMMPMSLLQLPRSAVTTSIANAMLAGQPTHCRGLQPHTLNRIPLGSLRHLGRSCWRLAFLRCRDDLVPYFVMSPQQIAHLPPDAWAEVKPEFLARLTITGTELLRSPALKPLLSQIGTKSPDFESCSMIGRLFRRLDVGLVSSLPVGCLLRLSVSTISRITSAKILNALPTKVISSLSSIKVAAIQTSIFPSLNSTFLSNLGTGHAFCGCAGLKAEQFASMEHAPHLLKSLPSACLAWMPSKELLALSVKLIPRFANGAFSLINSDDLDLDLDEEKDSAGRQFLLQHMRAEQIQALLEAANYELHLCRNVRLNISEILRGDKTSYSSRRSMIGPILGRNCFPFLSLDSLSNVFPEDVQFLGVDFFSLLTSPQQVSHLPDEAFRYLSSSQIGAIPLSACGGLSAKKLVLLPKEAACRLPSSSCLQRMPPGELLTLLKHRKQLSLPSDLVQIIDMHHMRNADWDDNLSQQFTATDWNQLGRRVPEPLHPCRGIPAYQTVEETTVFWKNIDAVCFAMLPWLSDLQPKILPSLDPSLFLLLNETQIRQVEEALHVKIEYVREGTNRVIQSEGSSRITVVRPWSGTS